MLWFLHCAADFFTVGMATWYFKNSDLHLHSLGKILLLSKDGSSKSFCTVRPRWLRGMRKRTLELARAESWATRYKILRKPNVSHVIVHVELLRGSKDALRIFGKVLNTLLWFSMICCSTNSLVMISGHPQELGMLGYIEAFCSRNCRLCPNAVRFRFLLSVPVHLFDSSWGSFQFSCLIDFMGFLGLPTSTSVHTHFPGFVLCPCWCLECCKLTEM